jgi:hypothetical protein
MPGFGGSFSTRAKAAEEKKTKTMGSSISDNVTKSVSDSDQFFSVIGSASRVRVTLPQATTASVGTHFDIFIQESFTSGGELKIETGNTSDILFGGIYIIDASSGRPTFFTPSAAGYRILMNSDGTGRLAGGKITLTYIALNKIQVNGTLVGTGTSATCFVG